MRLSRLSIENFRGIEKVDLDLDDEVTVIIGPNNTGKTAIMEALTFVLDPRPRGRAQRGRSLAPWDFHVDAKGVQCTALSITLFFQEKAGRPWDADVVAALGDSVQTDTTKLRSVTLRVEGTLNGTQPEDDFTFLDLLGQPIPKARDSALRALRRLRPGFYLPALRDAGREFARNAAYWTPFIRDKHVAKVDRDRVELAIGKINDDLISAHKPFKQLQIDLATVGAAVDSNPTPGLRFEPLPPRVAELLSGTQLSATSPAGAWIPLEKHGEGTQSTAVLLLFEAYCNSQLVEEMDSDEAEPIVCIEEPEAHLHPHAVRGLWARLKALPGQKIIATHSGDLAERAFPGHLRRLAPGKQPGRIAASPASSKAARAFSYRLRGGRGDLLFARLWLLGEGETEMILFDAAAEILGINLDAGGILVVPYREVGGIDPVLDTADALGIGWYAMPDDDVQQGKGDQQKIKARPSFGTQGAMTVLPAIGPEEYLWGNGYQHIYESLVPTGAKGTLPSATAAGYFSAVIGCVTGAVGKPGAAKVVAAEMLQKSHVPAEIAAVLRASVALAQAL